MKMGLALALIPEREQMSTIKDLSDTFIKSGLFSDTRDVAQGIVKILKGLELGIAPIEAMMGLYIYNGRVCFYARLIGSQIKKSGKYNYRTTTHTNQECSIEFIEDGQVVGTSTFTIQDAHTAKLVKDGGAWQKTPRNMLFARALSNGARWYCPDVFSTPVYTPEELGASVNEDGDVIEGTIATAKPALHIVESTTVDEPAVVTPPEKPAQPKNGSKPKPKAITTEQHAHILERIPLAYPDESKRKKAVDGWLSWYQIDDLSELPASDHENFITKLETKIEKVEAVETAPSLDDLIAGLKVDVISYLESQVDMDVDLETMESELDAKAEMLMLQWCDKQDMSEINRFAVNTITNRLLKERKKAQRK